MSLHSFLHRGAAPAPPKRITIRRRLLGRGGRLPAAGMAAGLLSLGLASVQPAQAGMATWNGPATVTDWYSQPSFWTGGSLISNGFDYPGSGDDAVNSAFNAPMSLGADATVNSFFSNSAFTLNGGTFSGSQANAASTLTVNNLFTLNGGTINNFTVNGTQQAGGPAASVAFTTNGGNALSNTIINANLDLSAGNAYVRLFNTNTVNGAISLGAGGGNGIHLYNNASNLTLNGMLTGFGSVVQDNGGSTVTNNGTVNANNAAALTLGVSTFNNNATLGATNGGALAISNTTTNNSGAVKAVGAGSVVTLTSGTTFTGVGTTAQGNLITASGGGKVVVDGATLLGTINTDANTALVFTTNGGNNLNNTTVNGNLDLTSGGTGYLRLFNADTVNGAISLGAGGGNGLHLYNNAASLTLNGMLTGFGYVIEDNGGSTVTNNGTINANNSATALTLGVTNFNNSAGATTGATGAGSVLNLSNTTTTNDGLLSATGGGTLNLTGGTTLQSNADGHISSLGGTVNVQGATLLGTINGAGASTLVFNTDGRNNFNGTTANINLDLTSGGTGYLRLFNADTVNGAISLGAGGGNGLHLYNNAASLTLNGMLTGFGYVIEDNGGSTVTNNGTVNANSSGNTLVTGVTNLNNNNTLAATGGGILNLSNTFTNNYGALTASGANSVVNLTSGTTFTGVGTTAQGNLITASGGGKVVVDGVNLRGTINTDANTALVFTTNGGNNLDNTTVNGNLDLATNSNAYVRLFDTDTVNGAISLGEGPSSDGLHLYNNAASLTLNGMLTGFGYVIEDNGGSTVTNNGTVNANSSGNTLVTGVTNLNNNNTLAATGGGILNLSNTFTNNYGALTASGANSVVNLTSGTTFTGVGTTAQGNLITASGGGKVVVDGVNLRGTINTDANTALVFTTNGGNNLDNTTVNGNLDLATNSNAYVRLFDTDTVNGAISLGEGPSSDGLHLYNNAASLTLNGMLTGFGYVIEDNGGSTVTNNGTVNANSSGNTLVTGVTNLNNNNTLAATGGGILNLSNTFTNNYGALTASGANSVVNLTSGTTFTGVGTTAQGNLITASGGGKVVVDGVNLRGTINTDANTALVFTTNGGNNLDNTTVNGNLDLATNSNAYVRLFDTDTVNGAISLGEGPSSDGLHLYNNAANLVIGSTGTLQGFGYVIEDNGGSTVTNNGTISANASGQTLNINTSNFNNTGTAQANSGATLNVTSPNATNSGTVASLGGGTVNFTQGLTQTAGLTEVFGVLNASETLNGGKLVGAKTINGNIVNNGGIVQPVVGGPGFTSLNINGNFTQGSGGELDAFFGNYFHNLLNVSGQTTTGGTLGVFDLDQTPFTGTGSTGSQFTFLDYSGTLTPDGSTVNGFTQYFTNEIPDSNNSGTILGQNGFKYELLNDTVNKQLDIQIVTVGAPVPEASTTVSLGLLLALGLGGMVIAAKRKKSA